MNLRKIIKFFLFSKWKFLYKENYFLLFDGEGKAKKKLSSILSHKDFSVLYTRGEEINFLILFYAFFHMV